MIRGYAENQFPPTIGHDRLRSIIREFQSAIMSHSDRPSLGRAALSKFSLSFLVLAAFSAPALAVHTEAAFLNLKESSAEQKAAQDRQIDEKVASLQERLPKKPNIIYILADDLGYGDLGSYGQKKIDTPNLDWSGLEVCRSYPRPSWQSRGRISGGERRT